MIDQATKNAKFLRKSAYVVIDLRGNSGGNDRYGRKLAEALYGTEYVDARLGPVVSSCPSVFRASSENIDAVRKQITVFRASGNTDAASDYARGLQAMEASKSSSRALTGQATCHTATQGKPISSSLMPAPVIVLTDVGCFSSCINTVGWFRELGAMQVGQITGEDTHYSEVREVLLPSGLSTFATMDGVDARCASAHRPFHPDNTLRRGYSRHRRVGGVDTNPCPFLKSAESFGLDRQGAASGRPKGVGKQVILMHRCTNDDPTCKRSR